MFDWLAGIPDPDEVLRRTGRTRADLRELMRDAEVSQALDTRREAVFATPWRLEGGAARGARFLTEELTPHIQRLLAGAWDAVPYGYSVLELVYAKRGGRIGLGAVHQPPFEWFRPLPDGTLRYFPETGEGGARGLECRAEKFLLTARNGNYRNPYGEALLSSLYWPVTWRLQGWQLWLDFLDTFGAPIVVGKTSSYDQFVTAMQAQGVRRAVGWQPTGDKDEIDTITASAPGEFERLESALNRCIQRVVLGQTLTSDVGKSGSYAAAKVHDDVREDKRRADVRLITGSLQALVNTLWALNGFPGVAPEFVMQDDVGLERERADRDAVLAEKVFPKVGPYGAHFAPEYAIERYDLDASDIVVRDEPAVDPAAPAAPVADEGEANDEALFARLSAGGERFTPQQRVIERNVSALAPNLPAPIARANLRSAIAGARDRIDLEERLAALFDSQNPRFAELLERAHFAASVLGYLHAHDEAKD